MRNINHTDAGPRSSSWSHSYLHYTHDVQNPSPLYGASFRHQFGSSITDSFVSGSYSDTCLPTTTVYSRASSLSSDSSLPSTPPSRSQSPAAQTRATYAPHPKLSFILNHSCFSTNSWSSISVKLMQLSEGGRGWDEEKIVKKTLYQCSRKWGNGKTCTYLVEDKREHTDSDHDKDHKSDTAFTASLYTVRLSNNNNLRS